MGVNLEDALAAALAQVATLSAQLAGLTDELAAARAERAHLQARIEELLARLDELLAKRGKRARKSVSQGDSPEATPPEGPPSEGLPSEGPPPEGRAAPAASPPEPTAPAPDTATPPSVPPPNLADRPQPPARPAENEDDKPRKKRTPKLRPTLPIVEDPVVRPDICSHCGGSHLTSKEVLETVLIDHVRGYVRKRIVKRARARCCDCSRLTTPPVPYACLPRTHFTASFVAFVLYSKLAMHLPWERVIEDLTLQGYPIASSTLNDVAQRALEALAIIAKALWLQFKAGRYGQSDATGISVVTPHKEHVHHGQMFVFCWDKLVVFRYQPDKEGKTFKRMVEGFQGTLVLDASSTHNEALDLPGVYWAGCNAHGLRKFRDATEADPVLAPEGERWVAAMFDKDREGRDQGLTGEALLAWRQAHVAPIARAFKKWIAIVHPNTQPKTPLREATTYYADYWRPMTRFLGDPNLPMDNNFSERSLRAEAVGRSNWIYAGNERAAENLAVGYTLVQTAKAEGVDALSYLVWALERVVQCGEDVQLAARLTPGAYKEAQKARDG